MNVISLDLGTKTGWAARLADGETLSGMFHTLSRGASRDRYLNFRAFLDSCLPMCGGHIDKCFYEQVQRHTGTRAAHVYGGFLATLSSFCVEHSIECVGVGVSTIKKYIAGHGFASKDEVISAVNSAGYSVSDDNEADALALLLYALDERPLDIFWCHGVKLESEKKSRYEMFCQDTMTAKEYRKLMRGKSRCKVGGSVFRQQNLFRRGKR